MGWLKDFFTNIFGAFWNDLGELALKLIMGPVAFFLFGPIFKISGRIAEFIMSKFIMPQLDSVGMVTDSLAAWFIYCIRLQECVSSMITFLVCGFMVSMVKKVF